jgi:hypothetical protein
MCSGTAFDGKSLHNKGEQQNALRRAVFFSRLGDIRDRSYENQRHRASGLNLLVAAIILWNTTYLQRASITCAINGAIQPLVIWPICRHSAGAHQSNRRLPLGHSAGPRSR